MGPRCQPATNTTGVLTPSIAIAVDNYQGSPRGVDESLPTQTGTETLGVLSSGVLPFRKHTTPTVHSEAMPTVTADQIPGLLTAAGTLQFRQGADRRIHGVDEPLNTVVANGAGHGMLSSGWYKQNGSTGVETAPHPVSDPFGALTSRDTTGLLAAEWREALGNLRIEDCYFRMMAPHEVGRGCGFDPDFGDDYQGTFVVWGSNRDQVDGYGNAVSPPVGEWIGLRLRAVLHAEPGAD